MPHRSKCLLHFRMVASPHSICWHWDCWCPHLHINSIRILPFTGGLGELGELGELHYPNPNPDLDPNPSQTLLRRERKREGNFTTSDPNPSRERVVDPALTPGGESFVHLYTARWVHIRSSCCGLVVIWCYIKRILQHANAQTYTFRIIQVDGKSIQEPVFR